MAVLALNTASIPLATRAAARAPRARRVVAPKVRRDARARDATRRDARSRRSMDVQSTIDANAPTRATTASTAVEGARVRSRGDRDASRPSRARRGSDANARSIDRSIASPYRRIFAIPKGFDRARG